ncbi:MAG TPA: RelA/SpoT family protein [Bacteroidales bacterium]|mgnify:CR=1 FL=1|nr:bifunctional (p)ppGpp synthetase/guanosine-3',5'-bis(diphosphate) 3'-pyrophosphohydrolase [Bacteroidales bacterium]HRX96865.1 RelA/SpoT family protein [Bacteroidales bacterium]
MNQSTQNTQRIKKIYKSLLIYCAPILNKDESVRLRKAFDKVLEFHYPNWEKNGEDYVYHSIEVARIVLKEVNLGMTSVICALLHNVVDGEITTLNDIKKEFGEEVAIIVEGYNKLSDIQTEKISIHSDSFRKLYLSLVPDIRVILIKLAHRLYDMRKFNEIPVEKSQKFLAEVNHIYIPIAHRLGLYNVKTELEELWMKHAHTAIYRSISKKVKDSRAKQNAYIADFVSPIEKELFKQGFEFEIKGRPKSIHSIWQKMKKQNVGFDEVYDLFAIRVIVDTPRNKEKADCWKVYSIVTDIYQPNPNRLRDWITTPKASGYESLHTTVFGPNGKWVEVQIRTKRMDSVAEQGLAAHWKYKEGGKKAEQEEWMFRIRDVIENADAEILDKAGVSKIDLYSDKTFVFTPEGDLRTLPHGATVLDFAYDIHTSVGDMCNGARVNNRIVPIRYVLQNGDRVEIITSKNQKPKMDWLSFVVTNKAKGKIKRAMKEERFQEAEIGKEILRRKLRNRKIQFNDAIVDKLIKQYKLSSSVDLYYLIAIEKIDLNDIKKSISDEDQEKTTIAKDLPADAEKSVKQTKTDESRDYMVIDNDIDNLDYELARCCNPISGDAVFGFVTVGKGITIHRINCPNARQMLSKYNYRVIDVKWRKTDEHKTWLTTINIVGDDDVGILNNITTVISNDFKVNMVSLNVDSGKGNGFEARIKLSVKDTSHLEMLIHKLLKIKGVKKATRINLS